MYDYENNRHDMMQERQHLFRCECSACRLGSSSLLLRCQSRLPLFLRKKTLALICCHRFELGLQDLGFFLLLDLLCQSTCNSLIGKLQSKPCAAVSAESSIYLHIKHSITCTRISFTCSFKDSASCARCAAARSSASADASSAANLASGKVRAASARSASNSSFACACEMACHKRFCLSETHDTQRAQD